MKRALLVTMDFPPTRGGIQTMAREIVTRAQVFDFTVIAPDVPGARAHDVMAGGAIRRVRAWPIGRRGAIPALARAAFTELRSKRYEVVLALHANASIGPALTKTPMVVFCHGGELRSELIRTVARRTFPRARRVLANSRFSRSEVIALGVDPAKVSVLPVGAPEPQAVSEHDLQATKRAWGPGRTLLTVARLVPHKGVDASLRALALLPDDVRLVVVGDGPEREALRQLAVSLGVLDRVSFVGALDDEQLRAHYQAADAFVGLSRATAQGFEGSGIALLEAATYGLPIVAGRSGAIPETITDGVTGLLVDPDDPEEVARAIERALKDGAGMGERARTLAHGERSWKRFVEQLEERAEDATRR